MPDFFTSAGAGTAAEIWAAAGAVGESVAPTTERDAKQPSHRSLRYHSLAAVALATAAGSLIAGCATTTVNAAWTDPQFAGRSLRGERILVICDADSTAVKRTCQAHLAAQIAALGATPVSGPETADLTVGPPPANDRTLAAAKSAGAKAILAATVAPDATFARPGPTVSVGVGGWGGSRGGVTGGGVGVGVPVGGGQVESAYGADIVLTDVDTVRLMWTGKVTTPASQDINGQMSELAKAGVDAARSAGFF